MITLKLCFWGRLWEIQLSYPRLRAVSRELCVMRYEESGGWDAWESFQISLSFNCMVLLFRLILL